MRDLSSLFFNISSSVMASVELREMPKIHRCYENKFAFYFHSYFIHILHKEVILAITSNGSAFALYRDQEKIFAHSGLEILTLHLSEIYLA